jgi:hypothetical protein
MSFVKPLARSGMFGLAGLAATKKDKKPNPSMVNGTQPPTSSLITNPTLY